MKKEIFSRFKIIKINDRVVAFFRCLKVHLLYKKLNRQSKITINCRTPAGWMHDQIFSDFAKIDPRLFHPEQLDKMMQKDQQMNGSLMLIRYRIQNNALKSSCLPHLGQNPRASSFQKSLNELLKTTKIPDLDCIISLCDAVNHTDLPGVIFSFAASKFLDHSVALIPDFEELEGHSDICKQVKKGLERFPWEKRRPQAVWRGAMSGMHFTMENFLRSPRAQVVSASLIDPELIDAKFTAAIQSDHPKKMRQVIKPYFSKPMRIWEHLQYKYQILIDGNSCSYSRTHWQLLSHSLIFKQESSDVQWYYRALLPDVHYISVSSDFSDLIDKIRWAQNHDGEVQQIAWNARQFALNNLRREDVFFYLKRLLKEYAKKQKDVNV